MPRSGDDNDKELQDRITEVLELQENLAEAEGQLNDVMVATTVVQGENLIQCYNGVGECLDHAI